MDRFLCLGPLSRAHFQLTACTSLFIAAKLRSVHLFPRGIFEYHTDFAVTSSQIVVSIRFRISFSFAYPIYEGWGQNHPIGATLEYLTTCSSAFSPLATSWSNFQNYLLNSKLQKENFQKNEIFCSWNDFACINHMSAHICTNLLTKIGFSAFLHLVLLSVSVIWELRYSGMGVRYL